MELLPVEEQEAVLRRQNSVSRARPAGREGPDVRFHRLAPIRREGRDVDERRHFGSITRFGGRRPFPRPRLAKAPTLQPEAICGTWAIRPRISAAALSRQLLPGPRCRFSPNLLVVLFSEFRNR